MNRLRCELRAAELDGRRLSGHAAVFDRHAQIRGAWETIAPGAFDDVLARGEDVRALVNHDPTLLLGRTNAGTLKLDVDDVGLRFEVDLPETSYGDDVAALVRRGDLDGASFGFIPGTDTIGAAPDGRQLRTHTAVSRLLDVSVVTYPAYDGTDVSLRSVSFSAPRWRSQAIIARHRARYGRYL
jgi:HK97 family phage prohead protease